MLTCHVSNYPVYEEQMDEKRNKTTQNRTSGGPIIVIVEWYRLQPVAVGAVTRQLWSKLTLEPMRKSDAWLASSLEQWHWKLCTVGYHASYTPPYQCVLVITAIKRAVNVFLSNVILNVCGFLYNVKQLLLFLPYVYWL